ncbi:MAG: sigma-70 family RNA polymerase sigma factor [Verrucomicrobiae bacterium]|nr:sigma-70 family RNA polymerase sigma factor [Verrucomicrobiae bacterium]
MTTSHPIFPTSEDEPLKSYRASRDINQFPSKASAFPTTHWSVVLMAGAQNQPDGRKALESLCLNYWFPIYSYIRRRGRSHHEAEDLTQDFLARLLARDDLERACPERGRFRTFLLTSVKNFLTNDWHKQHTAKRGSGIPVLSLDLEGAEENFARELSHGDLAPDRAFDRSWALVLIERALAELRTEYQLSGRGALFEAVAPLVWGGGTPEPLSVHAQRIQMYEGAFKVAVHRLRKRLRERLESMVRETVSDPAEVEHEIRLLIASVG